jgi:hypothetical protein
MIGRRPRNGDMFPAISTVGLVSVRLRPSTSDVLDRLVLAKACG